MRTLTFFEKVMMYGMIGFCIEIIFTALSEPTIQLKGWTYIYMIPIWAIGFFTLTKLGNAWESNKYIKALDNSYYRYGKSILSLSSIPYHITRIILKAIYYMIALFVIEYTTGMLLLYTIGQIPWDYSYAKYNLHGVIKADFIPVWFFTGLIFDRVIKYLNKFQVYLD